MNEVMENMPNCFTFKNYFCNYHAKINANIISVITLSGGGVVLSVGDWGLDEQFPIPLGTPNS